MSPSAEPKPASADASAAVPVLFRLLCWLSPAFPTGAFSYSHGLEAATASGEVGDRESLEAWIVAIITEGSGRIDADILRDAHRAALCGDGVNLRDANHRGAAFRGTAELALESAQQGEAFLNTCRAAWPDPHPNPPPPAEEGAGTEHRPLALDGERGAVPLHPLPQAGERRVGAVHPPGHPFPPDRPSPPMEEEGGCICHSAAFGAAAAGAGITLTDALTGYLQAFAGNLVSAGLRLGVIGQTDGQRILAALEPLVAAAVQAALVRDAMDFGSATFALDIASMTHETQYSRLFRS